MRERRVTVCQYVSIGSSDGASLHKECQAEWSAPTHFSPNLAPRCKKFGHPVVESKDCWGTVFLESWSPFPIETMQRLTLQKLARGTGGTEQSASPC